MSSDDVDVIITDRDRYPDQLGDSGKQNLHSSSPPAAPLSSQDNGWDEEAEDAFGADFEKCLDSQSDNAPIPDPQSPNNGDPVAKDDSWDKEAEDAFGADMDEFLDDPSDDISVPAFRYPSSLETFPELDNKNTADMLPNDDVGLAETNSLFGDVEASEHDSLFGDD